MLGAWPLIMGITMWLQMKMNPEPPDPVQKQVFAWMPVIFTFMLGSFPAGLVIYWAWNNLLSVTQQYFIMRRNGVKVELWDNVRGTFGKKAEAKTYILERAAIQAHEFGTRSNRGALAPRFDQSEQTRKPGVLDTA